MVIIFLTKVFQKGTMFKRVYVSLSHEILCHAMVGDKVLWQPECAQSPPPLRKKIAPFGLLSVYVPVYISELTMRT